MCEGLPWMGWGSAIVWDAVFQVVVLVSDVHLDLELVYKF